MDAKTRLKFEFKIDEIKKTKHFENDFREYGLNQQDIKNGKINLNIGLGFDQKKELVFFNIKVNCFSMDGKHLLFGIETLFKYKIVDLNKLYRSEETKSYQIPDHFMNTLLGAAISGTRGMLAALNTTPEYQKIFLPMIQADQLIKDLKNQNQGKAGKQ
ncbi:MAG: hypothetical protein RBT06_02480 [Smithellaceae bacterium]|jgi:hypothetical protein|nr:hypothetical protein [Smithellaceae bacterium]